MRRKKASLYRRIKLREWGQAPSSADECCRAVKMASNASVFKLALLAIFVFFPGTGAFCINAFRAAALPCLSFFLVVHTPIFHDLNDGAHRLPQITQGILYAGRYFRIYGSGDQPVRFHRAQTVSQYFLTDTFQRFSEFIETPWALQKVS